MKDKLTFNLRYLRENQDTQYPEQSPEEGKCNNYNLRNNVRNPEIPDAKFKQDQSVPYTVHNYTVSPTVETTFNAYQQNKTSVHFLIDKEGELIDKEGEIFKLVPVTCRAYHAGAGGLHYPSKWNPHLPENILKNDMNSFSVGINYVNTGLEDYPESQINAGLRLQEWLTTNIHSNPKMLLAHSDWAPGRKIGPGPYFPWQTFAKAEEKGFSHNFGVYCFKERKENSEIIVSYKDESKQDKDTIEDIQRQLEELGHKVLNNEGTNLGKLDDQTISAMLSMKLHYRGQDIVNDLNQKILWENLWHSNTKENREALGGIWDENDAMVLGDVLNQLSGD
ncbi:N-acetylmuramoyl-L-alanine amidase [Candidatus Tisiphia endosymbiont of Micropterix aruncella]|uniref:N-acetylmuramoyl-L-alanine amidase n=1 Tax=Candidatus Tisiphia endosymbiont of Micropterix aruncella TaxID=3066271 RepID=UPI003AA7D936